jgi:hypothetical protein
MKFAALSTWLLKPACRLQQQVPSGENFVAAGCCMCQASALHHQPIAEQVVTATAA